LFLNPSFGLTRTTMRAHICMGIALLLFLTAAPVSAQETDTTSAKPAVQKHNPRMALLMSAIIPGLGQVYNQKYWKVPIIYGAEGAFAYFVGFNQLKYKKFRDAIVNGSAGSKTLIDGQYYNYEILPRGRDYYRRNRDLSVLGLGAIYFLNIVDAMIDAHFFNYDVSDDLTLHVQPVMVNSPGLTAAIGLRIDIGF
jgi:hypothetical protein